MKPSALLQLIVLFALPFAGGPGYVLAYAILLVKVLLGARHAIEALSVAAILGSLNPAIYPHSDIGDIARWPVLMAAAAAGLTRAFHSGYGMPKAWFTALLFVGVATICSFFSSYALDVSTFKLATFMMGATAVLGNAMVAERQEPGSVLRWLITFAAFILIVSLPLIFLDAGYTRNDRGFQGVVNHPQTFGSMLSLFTVVSVVVAFTGRFRSRLIWPLVAIAVISLVATESRIAVLSALVGMFAAFVVGFVMDPRTTLRQRRRALAASLAGFAAILASPFYAVALGETVRDFVYKWDVGYTVAESLYTARQRMVEDSLENFQRHPIAGIGFGLPSQSHMLDIDYAFGLPVTAPAEKGVIFTAVLEENGVVGFVVFLFLLVSLVRPAVRARSAIAAAAIVTSLVLNLAEALFFSVGQVGLLVWVFMAYAATAGRDDMVEGRAAPPGEPDMIYSFPGVVPASGPVPPGPGGGPPSASR